jgi:hypothetical protein
MIIYLQRIRMGKSGPLFSNRSACFPAQTLTKLRELRDSKLKFKSLDEFDIPKSLDSGIRVFYWNFLKKQTFKSNTMDAHDVCRCSNNKITASGHPISGASASGILCIFPDQLNNYLYQVFTSAS